MFRTMGQRVQVIEDQCIPSWLGLSPSDARPNYWQESYPSLIISDFPGNESTIDVCLGGFLRLTAIRAIGQVWRGYHLLCIIFSLSMHRSVF